MFAVNNYLQYIQLIMNASSFIVKEFIAIIQTTDNRCWEETKRKFYLYKKF